MKKIILTILLCFFSCTKLNALSNIKLNAGELVPNFDKNITHYNVYVDDKTYELNLECIKDDNDLEINYDKTVTLIEGENIIKIKVKDISNNEITYVLNVQRGDFIEEKDNAFLREIIIEGYELDFKYDVYEYEITIDENINELKIDYTPFNLNSYTIQTGGFNLNKNKNIVEIKVVSEDGESSNTYKIIVNKTITTFKEESEETNIFGKTSLTKKEKVITFSIICSTSFLILIIVYLILFRRRKRS